MTPPLSHEEFRSRVCGLCWLSKKNSVRKITPDLQQKIRLYQYAEYDILNEALPTVICTSCRMQLLRCEKNPDCIPVTDMDYSCLIPPPVRTRSSTGVCSCFLCSKGRQTLVPQTPDPNPNPPPIKICPECKGKLSPGVSHVCTRAERNENILDLVREVSDRSRGQILSQSLKEVREEAGADQLYLQTKGTPLPVTIGGAKQKQSRQIFSQEDSKHLQNMRHFSDNDMRAIEQATRKVFGRKSVEKGTREARVALNHELDYLFEGKHMKLKYKPKKKKDESTSEITEDEDVDLDSDGCYDVVRPVVLCSDPEELIYKVIHDRNMDPQNTDIKIGADDGQNIFKICLQVLSHDGDQNSDSGGAASVCSDKFKQGGVHKLLMLLAVPNVQELYANLQILLGELSLDSIDFSITSDLKMVLIMLGKDSGSCRHACIYCEDGTPWKTPSKLNTLGSLQKWHDMWVADGSRDMRSKDFQNMRNPPLLKGAPEDLILELISPPELHLELGIPDKLTTELIKNVFPDEKAGKEFMSKFYKKENITVCGKQGGKLEGNATRKFLKTTHSLELELRKVSPELFMKGLPFTRTLKAFDNVVHSCFGAILLEGWQDHIAEFSACYSVLTSSKGNPISITPKVHMVMTHVKQFLEMKADGKGLGYWSEQAFESVHADFKEMWETVKVDIDHPEFLTKLLSCVIRWNSRHI